MGPMDLRAAKPRRYRASFLHRGKWWIAWTDDLPGALTQGRTLDEARENLKDAIAMMLEPVAPRNPPEPRTKIVHETISV